MVDRIGAKQVLLAGNLLQCVGFLAYLVADSFVGRDRCGRWSSRVGRTAFWGSYGNIVAAISAPGEREKWFGFLGALRNVGFAVGGLVSGVAITIGTDGGVRRGGRRQRGVVRRRVRAAARGAGHASAASTGRSRGRGGRCCGTGRTGCCGWPSSPTRSR